MDYKKKQSYASKERFRQSSCYGKVQHKTKIAAEYVLNEMRDNATLAVYKCSVCRAFHIGNTKKKV